MHETVRARVQCFGLKDSGIALMHVFFVEVSGQEDVVLGYTIRLRT